MNSVSVDSLKLSARCGCTANRLKKRCTALLEIPVCPASVRVLQCVEPSAGLVLSVVLISIATRSSLMLRGAPGRSSSCSPLMRCSTNRLRHLPTVAGLSSSRWATLRLLTSNSQASTMRARSTRAADRLRERAIEASCARSASSNINCAFGRPVTIGYLHVTRYPKCKQTLCYEFMGHHTSRSLRCANKSTAAGGEAQHRALPCRLHVSIDATRVCSFEVTKCDLKRC